MAGKNYSKPLEKIFRKLGANFSLHDRPLPYEQVFSVTGLLPGIARRADQLCSLCLGYGLGVTFEEAEGSILGNRVIFDDATPDVLRYLCLVDVVYELVNASPSDTVALDELLYD